MKQSIKKPLKKPVSKRMKRFDEGGYTGDDPIVKYRMGKLSEADTYDAMGQKDLANASRAKEPKVAPSAPSAPKTRTDNFYDTSTEKEIADASFPKANIEETPVKAPVKTPVKAVTKRVVTPAKTNYIPNKDVVKDNRDVTQDYDLDQNDRKLRQFGLDNRDQNDRKSNQVKSTKAAPFGSEESGRQMKEDEDRLLAKLKNTSVEDVVGAGLSLLPIGRAAGLLKKGVGALKTIKPSRLGYDKEPSPAQLGYKKDPNPPVPKSIKEVTKNEKMDAKREQAYREAAMGMKKGGKVKTFKQGGSVSSASKRADGCAIRGKTRA